ncbi:MAG: hypothetical protein ACK4ZE_00195 [Sphingorhabdus sp.]
MNKNATRWKRILAVRAIQRQMAEIQLNKCVADVANLADLGDRIGAIRGAAQPASGTHDGAVLRSVCELTARLDSAHHALANPTRLAIETRDRQQRAVILAKQSEMIVDKLTIAITAKDEKLSEDRQSRTAIFRKPSSRGANL